MIDIINLLIRDGMFPIEVDDGNELNILAFSQALLHELSLYPCLWTYTVEGTHHEDVIEIFDFLHQ